MVVTRNVLDYDLVKGARLRIKGWTCEREVKLNWNACRHCAPAESTSRPHRAYLNLVKKPSKESNGESPTPGS